MVEASRRKLRLAVPCASSQAVMESIRDILSVDLAHLIAIGDKESIVESAAVQGIAVGRLEIIDADGERDAVRIAVQLAKQGRVDVIMKGHVHTDVLLSAVLDWSSGLRTGQRLSHIYHVTGIGPRPLLITDSGVNIAPDLSIKREILRNAVDFAHRVGIPMPRVAILSATEEPSLRMPSSIEARAVMEWAEAERLDCVAFGPIALDCVLSEEAAARKGLETEVAGKSDIILVPNIETGNALSKFMIHVMGGVAAGFVVGTRIPLVVPSRADRAVARVKAVELLALRTDCASSHLEQVTVA